MGKLSFLIGGPQGRGVETASFMFIYAVGSAGYYVWARREFWSNIAGGRHSYVVGTVSERWPAPAPGNAVKLALTFDGHAVLEHVGHLAPGGVLVYNSEEEAKTPDSYPMMSRALAERLKAYARQHGFEPTVGNFVKHLRERGVEAVAVPYSKSISEIGRKIGVTSPVMLARLVNTFVVSLGAALLGLTDEHVSRGVAFALGKKADVIEQNRKVAVEAMRLVDRRVAQLSQREPGVKRIFWNGNEAAGMAKALAGIRFVSYYPITPATDDAMTFERLIPFPARGPAERAGAIAFQAEDELSAIATATGAAIAGARAATATSGPGFSLMAEALSMAGMMEVGVVVNLWMRAGPSTGQATREGQEDLLFALSIGHGEWPRIVLASGDVEEAFHDTFKVANWAERYRMPVIHLLDKNISNNFVVMPLPSPGRVEPTPPVVYPEVKEVEAYPPDQPVAPRLLPGISNAVFHLNSLEHDPEGDPEEDPVVAQTMYRKRMAKLELVDREVPPEDKAVYYGPDSAEEVIVGWGSVKPAVLTALEELEGVGFLQIRMFSPFPTDLVRRYLEGRRAIFVEHNYLGQAALVTRMHTGIEPAAVAVKYNGRPITPDDVVEAYRRFRRGERRIELDTEL